MVTIELSSDEQIIQYLKTFADLPHQSSLLWTKKQYKENFSALRKTAIWPLLANPFYLSIAAEMIPILCEQHKELDTLTFLRKAENDVLTHLYKAFISLTAKRLSEATKKSNHFIPPETFIMYAAQLANELVKQPNHAISWPICTDALEEQFRKFFVPSNEYPHPNILYQPWLINREINNDKVWMFMSDGFLKTFLSLFNEKAHLQLNNVKAVLEQYPMKLKASTYLYGNKNYPLSHFAIKSSHGLRRDQSSDHKMTFK